MTDDFETYLENEAEKNEAIHAKVMELISESDEPKDKAMLLLLDQIQSSLRTNTSVTLRMARSMEVHFKRFNDHVGEFKQHEIREEKFIGKAKGAWVVLAAVLGLAQVTGVVMINRALDRDSAIERRLDRIEISAARSHKHP